MALCEAYEQSPTSAMADILRTHIENMRKARVCRERHNALVEALDHS